MKGLSQVILDKGRAAVTSVLQDINDEYNCRKDFIVKPEAVSFWSDGVGAGEVIEVAGNRYGLTDHSLSQLLQRCGIPSTYYDRMLKTQNYSLAKTNIQTMILQNTDGLMVREVNGVAKGILSPSYKRMDASVVFHAFAKSALDHGYVPYTGKNTQSRYTVTFLKDNVIQVGDDEVVYGVRMSTSDYGSSSLSIQMFLLRLLCLNGMTGIDLFKKVHLGRRFQADFGGDTVELSDTTEKLDALTLASGINDVLKQAYSFEEGLTDRILKAQMTVPDVKELIERLRKRGKVGKEFGNRIIEVYDDTSIGVDRLPSQKNLWRFANVISLLAKERNGDTQLDLEDESYNLLVG